MTIPITPDSISGGVLVASPSTELRERVRQTFSDHHWPVQEAIGGAEALQRLESGHWHVLYLDRHLPDLDAEELIGIIQRRFPGIAVVLVDSDQSQISSQPQTRTPREASAVIQTSAPAAPAATVRRRSSDRARPSSAEAAARILDAEAQPLPETDPTNARPEKARQPKLRKDKARHRKVAAIAQAVREGTHRFSPELIAEAILSQHLGPELSPVKPIADSLPRQSLVDSNTETTLHPANPAAAELAGENDRVEDAEAADKPTDRPA